MTWAFTDNAKKVRHAIYAQYLSNGRGENIAAISHATKLSYTDVKSALEELERGTMIMMQPKTHDVVKCPPWTNTPTCHSVERNEKHVCYAGCCIEALNISHCYPGETITIRTACAQSGKELVLRLKEGQVLEHTPGIVMHFGVSPYEWPNDWFKACENNNFFASADQVRAWETARPEFKGAMITADKFSKLATFGYDRRFKYDRPADEHPAVIIQMLRNNDIAFPSAWERRKG